MIVEHSISRLQNERQLRLAAASELQRLVAERDQLLAEVNCWRTSSGTLFTSIEPAPLGPNLVTLANTHNESFGLFPNGFGDNMPEGQVEEEADPVEDGSDTGGANVAPVAGQHNTRQMEGMLSPLPLATDVPAMADVSEELLTAPQENSLHTLEPHPPFSDVFDFDASLEDVLPGPNIEQNVRSTHPDIPTIPVVFDYPERHASSMLIAGGRGLGDYPSNHNCPPPMHLFDNTFLGTANLFGSQSARTDNYISNQNHMIPQS
jgi:hypothetical protein